jgi:hypothetical protein
VLVRRQVSTQWRKVRAFFDEVRKLANSHGGYLAIVEICGFNQWLLKLLPEPAAPRRSSCNRESSLPTRPTAVTPAA